MPASSNQYNFAKPGKNKKNGGYKFHKWDLEQKQEPKGASQHKKAESDPCRSFIYLVHDKLNEGTRFSRQAIPVWIQHMHSTTLH